MQTIIASIEEILRGSPMLTEALSQGIINYSALARRLKPELEEKHLRGFTEGAVVMALKRLEKTMPASRSQKHATKTVRNIIMRSDMVQYAFRNSGSLHRMEEKLLRMAENEEDATVYFARGTFDTAILVSTNLEKALKDLTKEEKLIKRFDKLSFVSLRFSSDITHIPGIYYPFFQALAWRGINLIQIVSAFAELTFVFDAKEVDRALPVIRAVAEGR